MFASRMARPVSRATSISAPPHPSSRDHGRIAANPTASRFNTDPYGARGRAAGSDADSMVRDVLRSAGEPLDSASRGFFEPRFRADFSGVRVHTDRRAAESARAIDAAVYTVGRDIVLGSGAAKEARTPGSRLMAHELAHVVQQAGSEPREASRLAVTEPGDRIEREAEAVSSAVLAGAIAPSASAQAPAIARRTPEMPGGQQQDPVAAGAGPGAKARPDSSSFAAAYAKIGYNVWRGEEARHNVWAFVGGSVGKTFDNQNTCATRVSYGLNYGGAPIEHFNNSTSYHNYSSVVFEGKAGDDKNYIVGAPAMNAYLARNYGPPDAHLTTGQEGLDFEKTLPAGKAAIFAGVHHSGMIKDSSARDPYVMSDPDVLPVDAWKLA